MSTRLIVIGSGAERIVTPIFEKFDCNIAEPGLAGWRRSADTVRAAFGTLGVLKTDNIVPLTG